MKNLRPCPFCGQVEPYVDVVKSVMDARNLADRLARECLEWLNRLAGTEKPVVEWPNPPHDFVLALSSAPGVTIVFCTDGGKQPDKRVLQHLTLMLRSVWPTWSAWGEVEGIPKHPGMKTATFYEDDGDS